MLTAKIFQSGNSQAIRIPKEAHTDQKEFYIRRLGNGYVLSGRALAWFPTILWKTARSRLSMI